MFGSSPFGSQYFAEPQTDQAPIPHAGGGGFGTFAFGEPFFGKPERLVSVDIIGTGDCTQQRQICSGSGHVPVVEATPSGGGKPLRLRWDKKRQKWEVEPSEVYFEVALTQQHQTCSGRGSVHFIGDGRATQSQGASGAGRIQFRGIGSVSIPGRLRARGRAIQVFDGAGSVRVSLMPTLSDEDLAILLLTALD